MNTFNREAWSNPGASIILDAEAWNNHPERGGPFDAWGKIPTHADMFWHCYGHEIPLEVHGWWWSVTFGRWTALVTFSDGWHGWTWPHL